MGADKIEPGNRSVIRLYYLERPAGAVAPGTLPDLVWPTRDALVASVRHRATPDGRTLRTEEVALARALLERLECDDADILATPPAVFRIVRR